VIIQNSCLRVRVVGLDFEVHMHMYISSKWELFHMYLLGLSPTAVLHHADTYIDLGHGLLLKLLLL
jgi:hypothetical protein